MTVGLFDCPPDHPRWRTPNNIGTANLIAFPGTPVVIVRAGIGAICADRNQAVVYAPGQEYRRSLLHPRGDVCSYVAFSDEMLDGALTGRAARVLFRAGRCVVPAASWLRYQVALARTRGGRLDAAGFEEEVLTVVGEVLDAAPGGVASLSAVARRMESVRERLSADLEQQLTVVDVAAEFGVSPFHLVRQFKEHTGWTMHAYRTQLRLRAATEIALGETRRTLADVAAMTGFASHSHLTARFARAFGATPSAIRARAVGS
jgi:AraC-like DNA-binding protein